MGMSAEIMSHEEAMALPVEKRPICFRISSDMYHAVFEAIAHASLCWKPRPEGVFDTEEATKAAVDLCFKIAHERETLPATAERKEPCLTNASS